MKRTAVILLLIVLLGLIAMPQAFAQNQGDTLYTGDSGHFASYPRVVRFSDGTLLSTFEANPNGAVTTWSFYRSTNNGASWSSAGSISLSGVSGSCCEALYVFPQQLGSYSQDTVLFAVNTWGSNDASRKVQIYRSSDKGSNWTSHSTAYAGGPTWEPEFIVDSSGRLVMFVSDERQQSSGYNQFIGEIISSDGGVNWGSESYVVAKNDNTARPGMARVTKLNDGSYMMAYEVCGSGYNCDLYTRKSADGTNWGTASDLGSRVTLSDGRHFNSTAVIANANGQIMVMGKSLMDSGNNITSDSGSYMFINSKSDGTGTWTPYPLPFQINGTNTSNHVGNYSSAWLPSTDGKTLLQLASTQNGSGYYDMRYGTGPLLKNPSFENDNGQTQSITAWSTWCGSNGTSCDADYTENGFNAAPHSGGYKLVHYKSSPYQVTTYQDISVPNGNYKVSVWYQDYGGTNHSLQVNFYDSANTMTSVNTSQTGTWTKLTTPTITVTTGTLRVGLASYDTAGGHAAIWDDVEVVKQ